MMTDHQKAQIIKLRAAGNGYGKIARTLGISLNTVKSFCRRNDISRNSPSHCDIHRRNDLPVRTAGGDPAD
jgi:DNA invertase Pin-like site-specific DNA recombinase